MFLHDTCKESFMLHHKFSELRRTTEYQKSIGTFVTLHKYGTNLKEYFQ